MTLCVCIFAAESFFDVTKKIFFEDKRCLSVQMFRAGSSGKINSTKELWGAIGGGAGSSGKIGSGQSSFAVKFKAPEPTNGLGQRQSFDVAASFPDGKRRFRLIVKDVGRLKKNLTELVASVQGIDVLVLTPDGQWATEVELRDSVLKKFKGAFGQIMDKVGNRNEIAENDMVYIEQEIMNKLWDDVLQANGQVPRPLQGTLDPRLVLNYDTSRGAGSGSGGRAIRADSRFDTSRTDLFKMLLILVLCLLIYGAFSR